METTNSLVHVDVQFFSTDKRGEPDAWWSEDLATHPHVGEFIYHEHLTGKYKVVEVKWALKRTDHIFLNPTQPKADVMVVAVLVKE